jgi:NAD(P)-dependent dehydrogenase (short-subunit alcohol dehydrogenase family)
MGQRWTSADVPDQMGQTAVVTGANTGLGFEVARMLAKRGGTVVLACRDLRKAADAAVAVGSGSDVAVGVVRLDLTSLESVREAAAELRHRFETIHLLVNNAGVMMTPFTRTEDGFELQFGTNHLGPFAFTGLLLDRIAMRVVTVSSVLHRRGKLDLATWNDERGYGRSSAYARSKLANLLFAYELDRRLRAVGSGTLSLAAHPGYANTDLARHLPAFMEFGARMAAPLIGQSAAMGALPILRAATDPAALGGTFYGPAGLTHSRGYPAVASSSALSHDEGLAARLWDESERLTGVSYLPR